MKLVKNAIEKAEKVKKEVNRLLPGVSGLQGIFRWGAYANCREQGFLIHITLDEPVNNERLYWVAFSESRNSDEMRVYYGKGYPNTTGGFPGTELDYKNNLIYVKTDHPEWPTTTAMEVCDAISAMTCPPPTKRRA